MRYCCAPTSSFAGSADIQPGEKVLINGAGASIGTFAVQIAKAMGAKVTAVDSGIKENMLRQIGAEHFIDYNKQNFTKIGQTYDIIFNMVAGSGYSACISALKPKGRYLLANPRIMDMQKSFFTNKFSNKKVSFAFAGEKKEELLELKKMIEDGSIIPVVDKVFKMEEAAQAHHRVKSEQRLGIVVISMRNSQ
jgi:NADPH:quinone reductase-like Zn-dependent oxidoreductase